MAWRNKKRKHAEERDIRIGLYPKETGSYSWIPAPPSNEPFPKGIVCGGRIETGQLAYIGRADVGDQTPVGFFLEETREIHVPYGCNEHQLQQFDMLVVNDQNILCWQRCSNGRPPENSSCVPLEVETRFDEKMLVGRTCTPLTDGETYEGIQLQLHSRFVQTENTCRPGKIHPSHNCLYIPFSGREYIFNEHEMLMLKTSPGSLQMICRWAILHQLKVLHPNLNKVIEKLSLPPKLKKLLKDGHM